MQGMGAGGGGVGRRACFSFHSTESHPRTGSADLWPLYVSKESGSQGGKSLTHRVSARAGSQREPHQLLAPWATQPRDPGSATAFSPAANVIRQANQDPGLEKKSGPAHLTLSHRLSLKPPDSKSHPNSPLQPAGPTAHRGTPLPSPGLAQAVGGRAWATSHRDGWSVRRHC